MSAIRETWFISDLHLDARYPEITQNFFKLINNLTKSTVDALYILGDLFEVWVGDDDQSSFNVEIITRLKNLTDSGLPVYFLAGNRDFLIGKKFFAMTGCRPLVEEAVIDLYGERVLLMHGDTLCTEDATYLKTRKFFRNPVTQFCYLALPLSARKHIAFKLRMKSQRHMQYLTDAAMDVTQAEVIKQMRAHHVNCLIHGHTHKPKVHEFNDHGQLKKRIVLNAWHENGNLLRWTNVRAFTLQDFNSDSDFNSCEYHLSNAIT